MDALFLTKEAKIYNGTKKASSLSGAEKTGLLHVKDEIRTISNTIQKDKLKMDQRPKYKTTNYKTLGRKYRQNTE